MSEWISVKDILPRNGQVVDIWAVYPPHKKCTAELLSDIGHHDPSDLDGWRVTSVTYQIQDLGEGAINVFTKPNSSGYMEFCVENEDVTHWMPLPEQPMNEDDV